MAQLESDREELMAEATALVPRVEWMDDSGQRVVAGLFRDGRLAVYFEADPVYQFDSSGRLRRAFACGRLYRTQGETLAELTRQRGNRSTQLNRRDLNHKETTEFLQDAVSRLNRLHERISEAMSPHRVVAEDESDADAVELLRGRIRQAAETSALAPRIRGKR
ncbi:hypothetical protein [Stratiformator vulcanicus]|uniref:Uncharacterized protein n=1 Tax=Stratiformator vulcanicus TaxID=2527980 RepID=A0A517R635_9PLAN|nr:hypothetical protein [Stratiformator vulcanicus]QDT39305.1 hypothetical protein Pan189_37110 [Stratiformator vulcanicus]